MSLNDYDNQTFETIFERQARVQREFMGQVYNSPFAKQLNMNMWQDRANDIIELYDYHDIEKAIAHAKSVVPRITATTFTECKNTIDQLFLELETYLRESCSQIA